MKTIPDNLYHRYLVAASGKLCTLDALLRTLLPAGHKVCRTLTLTLTLAGHKVCLRAPPRPVVALCIAYPTPA